MNKLYLVAVSYDISKFNSETQIIGIFDSLKDAETARQQFVAHINTNAGRSSVQIELEEWYEAIEIKEVDLNETYFRNGIILKN
ncbi:hypothetical protein [Enterococcus sp. AZ196]|uniref:hypothetical protein n=1 Tax=Enterococcus sp. AZ196 TaxID=2774659 RepID=UPI003D2D8620